MLKAKYNKILADYLADFKYLPEQGSEEWLKGRKYTVGGSEIGAIAGTDSYKKGRRGLGELVASKLGVKAFSKNIWMRMGNLFEDVVRQYAEMVFDTNIYETGCIPGRKNENGETIQTFSPDGLGVTNVGKILKAFPAHPDVEEYLHTLEDYNISLFEFKAPGSRIPIDCWEPKTKGYHSQVLDGLDTIPIASFGIYVDAVVRRCSLYNLGKNPIWNPASYMQKMKDLGNPMYCGFIGIYRAEGNTTEYHPEEEDSDFDEYIEELFSRRPSVEEFTTWLLAAQKGAEYFKAQSPNFIDFGDCDNRTFSSMLINVVDKKTWKMYHSRLYKPDDDGLFDELQEFKSTYETIGVVPWKLFNAEIIPVVPEPGYVDNLMGQIGELINDIKYIAEAETDDIFDERFSEKYPEYKRKPRVKSNPSPSGSASTNLPQPKRYNASALQSLMDL